MEMPTECYRVEISILINFSFSTKRKISSTPKKKEALNSLLKVSKIALEDIFSLDTEQSVQNLVVYICNSHLKVDSSYYKRNTNWMTSAFVLILKERCRTILCKITSHVLFLV